MSKLIAILSVILYLVLGYQFAPLYSLWDDEANTALFAQTVQTTGDTSAIKNHNIIAYRNGAELNDQKKARYVSPMQYFFLAPWIDADQPEPANARIPFFLLSVVALILIYRRALMLQISPPLMLFLTSLIFGLTAFFLFSIQIRYYSLCLLWTVMIGEVYAFKGLHRTRDFFWLGVFSSLLFVSNYLMGVATLIALGVHALIYRRDIFRFNLKNVMSFNLPHLLISVPVFLTWNPLGKNVVTLHNTALDRLNLFYRNIRDFNGGHFGSILLLIAGLILLKGEAKKRFQQYGLVFIVYIAAISLFSPQPVRGTGLADIRYLLPLMLLGFVWAIDIGHSVLRKYPKGFYAFAFFFAFLSVPYAAKLEMPLVMLIQELKAPADDPYQKVADWLNANAHEQQTVVSSLDYATYPLMYLAPKLKYVGQITGDLTPEPDYAVSFCQEGVISQFESKYETAAEFQIGCREKFRPEIFLRNFGKNQERGTVKIFKRVSL